MQAVIASYRRKGRTMLGSDFCYCEGGIFFSFLDVLANFLANTSLNKEQQSVCKVCSHREAYENPVQNAKI